MLQHRRPGRAGRPQHSCYAARHHSARRLACGAFPWQRQTDPSLAKPPRPNERFSRSDIRRIKEQGPTLDDVTITLPNYEYQRDEKNATPELIFVPPTVLGDKYDAPQKEPDWDNHERKPLNLFLQGLRERNWTSPHYNQDAPKWHIELWVDQGRFLRRSFPGYRALVTTDDGSQFWVAVDRPGLHTMMKSKLSGSGFGTPYTWAREQIYSGHPEEHGWNQMLEELYEAYEERMPPATLKAFMEEEAASIPRERLGIDENYEDYNPATRHLAVEWKRTVPEASTVRAVEDLPTLGITFVITGFVFLAVLIGVFRSRKNRQPTDLQEALEFAQSKAKARKDGTTGVTLDDVAGLGNVKHEFEEIVAFLREPDKFTATGVKPPKGVLLDGPPGTGKTLIAKAIAGEANVGFYQMAGSEFVEAIVGVGAARVRDLFKRARSYEEPTLIFVDEIDAVALRRARGGEQANEEREQTLNQLLTEIDGFSPAAGVVFIAATNRSSLLDPALMRAGRFDRKIRISRPDEAARHEILQVHARRHKFDDSVDLRQVAADCPGLVGADLRNLLNEAALEAARRRAPAIQYRDILESIDRVLKGDRRPPFSTHTELSRMIVKSMAAAEGGRALYAADTRRRFGVIDAVEKVSIVRRGDSMARVTYVRTADDDYLVVTRRLMFAQLRTLLAGAAAAEVLGYEATTYTIQDFGKAAKKAEEIVQYYCVSDIGLTIYSKPVRRTYGFREGKEDVETLFATEFLQRHADPGLAKPMAGMIAKIEAEKHKIVREAYAEVKARLVELKPGLGRIALELYKKKELRGARVFEILDDATQEDV